MKKSYHLEGLWKGPDGLGVMKAFWLVCVTTLSDLTCNNQFLDVG